MRLFRHLLPPDRRGARLAALTAGPHAAHIGPAPVGEASGLDALARVLVVYEPERLAGRGERREADRALRAAARRVAAEARTHDPVRAERLLLALKPAWRALPAAQHAAATAARSALWDRVVRLCVEEFYAPAGDAEPCRRAGR